MVVVSPDGWVVAVVHAGYKSVLFTLMAGMLASVSSQDLRTGRVFGLLSPAVGWVLCLAASVVGSAVVCSKWSWKLLVLSSGSDLLAVCAMSGLSVAL